MARNRQILKRQKLQKARRFGRMIKFFLFSQHLAEQREQAARQKGKPHWTSQGFLPGKEISDE